ncbi:DUF1822 family protein [cf. Phormidesmis sp. LEGE 11477]|uniref:DUF1822 family protein n=1 Tax=cf. Phormidesmis sp. LEGE 11477 TaxID=1828680 RepID=UPI00188258D1|nr:DUF1822 family protein [cf. Phormidesmis sp. LEGE 11477]MBE9064413.1 DUF1822 family protein [cf. Phormidesmis sp. LEGE 11477]
MIHSIQQELTLSIPLTLAAHQTAQQFYRQHFDPHKAKQVYLNTLAVEAVRTYLGWLGIDSETQASDSWDPIVQTLADVADLEILGQGKLECRPVLPQETTCHIPPETNPGRIGYLPVLLDAKLETATLLGFIPSTDIQLDTQEVSLTTLRSLTSLFDLLKPQANNASITSLSRWLKGAVASGWQTIETLFGPQPVFSFRNLELSNPATSVTVRGKLLELGPLNSLVSSLVDEPSKAPPPDDHPANGLLSAATPRRQQANCRVALVVGITPSDALQSSIWVKLCPIGGNSHLPEELEIRILDDRDIVVMEAQSRQTDMLQLNFRGMLNEQFAVEVALNGVSLIEKFVI